MLVRYPWINDNKKSATKREVNVAAIAIRDERANPAYIIEATVGEKFSGWGATLT